MLVTAGTRRGRLRSGGLPCSEAREERAGDHTASRVLTGPRRTCPSQSRAGGHTQNSFHDCELLGGCKTRLDAFPPPRTEVPVSADARTRVTAVSADVKTRVTPAERPRPQLTESLSDGAEARFSLRNPRNPHTPALTAPTSMSPHAVWTSNHARYVSVCKHTRVCLGLWVSK